MRDKGWRHLIDAKTPLHVGPGEPPWGVFVSAYNDTERVRAVFDRVEARRKRWWLLPEYAYDEADGCPPDAFASSLNDEADFVDAALASTGLDGGSGRLCIDITGFLPQHILYLLRRLPPLGIPRFDMMYTEPLGYTQRADTIFSLGDVDQVRQVAGFGGPHVTDMSKDVLIVGVGYDHNLIDQVILNKESSHLVQLQCLPSLSADMYNESLLRLDRLLLPSKVRVDEQLFFATANDPFVTASVLADAVAMIRRARQGITNLYLSPLATKPQALGFGLFYIRECLRTATSIIYPFSARHSRGSSTGVGRSWLYPIDLS